MKFRLAILAVSAAFVSACTTASVASNPLEKRWNGKSAGVFFAAYGPPVSDNGSAGSATQYTWRGGFRGGLALRGRAFGFQGLHDQFDPRRL